METKNKVVLSVGLVAILAAGGFTVARAAQKNGGQLLSATTVCANVNGGVTCKVTGGEGTGKTVCSKKGTGMECTTTVSK
jgi:hypothetical protein